MDYVVNFAPDGRAYILGECEEFNLESRRVSILEAGEHNYFLDSISLTDIAELVKVLEVELGDRDYYLNRGGRVFTWFAGMFWRDIERTPEELLAHLQAMHVASPTNQQED